MTDLLIRLEYPEREQEIHYEFQDAKNAALEFFAEIKVKIKDQEIDRNELLSQKSLRSRKSTSSIRSSSMTSSKRAAIETVKLKIRHTKKATGNRKAARRIKTSRKGA